jgi:probable non-F420 flavinoid oxidoreductase
MTVIGFHASHEQVHPTALLEAVQLAEQVGFTGAMCSDHVAPWSVRQGESGFAWAWLGAALQATSLPFGVVNAPGQRYHPVVVAQAVATLAAMYPDRFWVAMGTGQNLNEHVTGAVWPRKQVRTARLMESVDVVRRLLAGQEVSHDGLVTVDRATVWTRPVTPPPILGPAVSVETARRAAGWADGLLTINQPHDHLREMVEAYRSAGGRGRLALQLHLSWAATEDEALAITHDQWRTNAFDPPVPWDIDLPQTFDEASKHVPAESLRESVRISSDPAQHAAWIAEYAEIGFDEVYLHHVGQEQRRWLEVFGERVLPQLDVTARAAT